ncbi:LLM class flavin-dependent oxidoreductase [Roseomonas sp. CAU 1739]|uniref:LLM class flavin-dependent oxidoreductase n=1 Tax=Roseomonas sp. CAU 1739 TaxID=3140364 RepID=UPI00325B2331
MMPPLGVALTGRDPVTSFEQIVAAAHAAEAGGFDFLCLPERAGLDPIALSAGLAAVTEHVGLIPACSAPFHQPYNLARRLGSIDHISRGRLGWLLQPTPSTQEAEHFGNLPLAMPEVAAARAAELAQVVAGLWDSWDDDAFTRDKASGLYFDRSRFHWLDHQGTHYKVRGPLDTARPPQGRPPLMVNGGNPIADAFAAAAAEVLHIVPRHLNEARSMRAALTRSLADHGRPPGALRILAGITPASSIVEPGPLQLAETPSMIAALMAEWCSSGAVDGFVIHLPDTAEAIGTFAAQVMPALRQRQLRPDGPRGMLRDRLGLAPAPSRHAHRAA